MSLDVDTTDLDGALRNDKPIDVPVSNLLSLAHDGDWVDLADVAEQIWKHIDESHGFCEVCFSQFMTQVLAHSYNRGIRNAARYLSVSVDDLDNGVSEMIDGDREPLTGITIPKVECQ